MTSSFAFVTLISSDSYLPGALVLAASLKELHPVPAQQLEVDFKTVCLVTPESVDVKSIKALRKAFDVVIGVELIEAPNSQGLELLGRPDLSTVLTKLHVFRLTEYSKIVFLDADILPIQPLSHLFLTPHEFSACPDVGWPDIFNSGCMVLEPGEDKFHQLTELMKSQGSWDGADQGLLNEWRGDNWHRLSFTYNTTPTAAYTYAPAYKRFGSAIKAIHFIGQNKPWTSIPWRAPIEHPSVESMHSYGYGNLVDRWYSVYDRHYRPAIIASEDDYRVQHYAPVWETATFDSPSQTFGLEDLKRMALEGVSQTVIPAPNKEGEGEYKSLPLEGRIDLMRPSKPDPPEETHATTDIGDHSSQQQHDTTAQHQEGPGQDYRPPGREGLPSYLYKAPEPQQPHHSAPHPSHHDHHSDQSHVQENQHQPDHHQGNQSWDQQQGDHGHHEHHSPVHRPSSPPLLVWNAAVDPPPHNPQPIVAMAFNEQQYDNAWDLPPGRPMRHENSYQDPWIPDTHDHNQAYQTYDHQQQRHQPLHQHHQQPDWKQPQHQQGPPSFPTGGQYNQAHSHGHQERTYPGHSHVEHNRYQPYPDSYHGQEIHNHATPRPYRQSRPEDFFKAPAPHKIPSHLMQEGHYAAVTGAEPNASKVEAIFPWEQRSRPTPRRVFPDWDPKPPRLSSPPSKSIAEIEKALIAASLGEQDASTTPPYVDPRSSSPPPPPHVKRKFNPPPIPPMRQGSTYINAWDTDNGIQRYASRLQGGRAGPSAMSPQPWPAHAGQEGQGSKGKNVPGAEKVEEEEEYTNWTEKAEASSRDGDDEDDEDGSPILSPKSSARRRAAKAKGNSYRHQGVQTDPKVTESRGVQVSSSSFTGIKHPAAPKSLPNYRNSYSGNDALDDPQGAFDETGYAPRQGRPLLPAFEEQLADPTFSPSIALHNAEERIKAAGGIGSPTGPILRTRDSSEDSITTAAESSIISSPTKEVEEVGTPRVQILMPEAAESSPISGRMRQGSGTTGRRMGGRVFSPTTGVDIFKRGSEEVLARFLMQDPSGWNDARANQGPPTPSAIQ